MGLGTPGGQARKHGAGVTQGHLHSEPPVPKAPHTTRHSGGPGEEVPTPQAPPCPKGKTATQGRQVTKREGSPVRFCPFPGFGPCESVPGLSLETHPHADYGHHSPRTKPRGPAQGTGFCPVSMTTCLALRAPMATDTTKCMKTLCRGLNGGPKIHTRPHPQSS